MALVVGCRSYIDIANSGFNLGHHRPDPLVSRLIEESSSKLESILGNANRNHPDPWEDPESRTLIMVPYTTIGDLLPRSAQGSGQ